ncbi:hypothetical protein [Streptomyces flaveolus]
MNARTGPEEESLPAGCAALAVAELVAVAERPHAGRREGPAIRTCQS